MERRHSYQALPDVHEQTRRKVSHLANTSQRIRFKQVEVRPKDAPAEQPPASPTRGKGKGASKQKSNATDDNDVVDLITGNIEPSDVPAQSSRRGGKEKGKGKQRTSGSQSSQSKPGHVEQAAVAPEEMTPALGDSMES